MHRLEAPIRELQLAASALEHRIERLHEVLEDDSEDKDLREHVELAGGDLDAAVGHLEEALERAREMP